MRGSIYEDFNGKDGHLMRVSRLDGDLEKMGLAIGFLRLATWQGRKQSGAFRWRCRDVVELEGESSG